MSKAVSLTVQGAEVGGVIVQLPPIAVQFCIVKEGPTPSRDTAIHRWKRQLVNNRLPPCTSNGTSQNSQFPAENPDPLITIESEYANCENRANEPVNALLI